MRKIYLLPFLIFACITSYGQTKKVREEARQIVEEGKRLYRLEMASWYGTDVFQEKYKGIAPVGGYFSCAEGNTTKCVFYSKGDEPKVIATIGFGNSFNPDSASVNFMQRSFTVTEQETYTLRIKAISMLNDPLFKPYPNANFNLVPIISNNEKKVYVLTGPKENGILLLGNDYLLTFDDNNNLVSKRALHSSTIALNYGEHDNEGSEVKGSFHTHLAKNGELMTATDICTLMLYKDLAKMKQHFVVSTNYVSVWNCETSELNIYTTKAFTEMLKEKKER